MSVKVKTVRCRNCKTKILPQGNSIYHFCSNSCRAEWIATESGQKYLGSIKRTSELERRKREKEERKQDKERMDKMKENVYNPALVLQRHVNKIVKLIDLGHPCISSNKICNKYDAGHLFSVSTDICFRFNLYNIYAQGVNSNQYRGGDQARYFDGIEREFGESHLKFIKELRIKYRNLSFEKWQLKEAIDEALKIIDELKNSDTIYSNLERLELREIYNKRLNLYP